MNVLLPLALSGCLLGCEPVEGPAPKAPNVPTPTAEAAPLTLALASYDPNEGRRVNLTLPKPLAKPSVTPLKDKPMLPKLLGRHSEPELRLNGRLIPSKDHERFIDGMALEVEIRK